VRVERKDGDVVVHLIDCDALNDQSMLALKTELVALVENLGAVHVLLDLTGVRIVTSDGLGLIIILHTKLQAAGGRLTITGVNPAVYEVFEVTQLTRLFDVRLAEPTTKGKAG
jgi:anti-sigma B factor antagonist